MTNDLLVIYHDYRLQFHSVDIGTLIAAMDSMITLIYSPFPELSKSVQYRFVNLQSSRHYDK